MIQRTAYAKLNLALHVVGQRDDGYHMLDSLVTFTEFGDVIEVDKPHHPHGPIAISLDGKFSEGLSSGPENLVTAAAFLLREAVKNSGIQPAPVEIMLIKNMPIASGIGGGSANAAATLLALQEFWGSDIELEKIALGLGADVPMCLQSKPLRARGIGEEIDLLDCNEIMHVVLVNPGLSVSTPDVFKRLENKQNPAIELNEPEQYPALSAISSDMRNDLEAPAIAYCPEIKTVLDQLHHHHASFARMSGSGATCFGIFQSEDQAVSAARSILEAYPSWWCVATQTRVS